MKPIDTICQDAKTSAEFLLSAVAGYYHAGQVARQIQQLGFDPDETLFNFCCAYNNEICFIFKEDAPQEEMARVVREFVATTNVSLTKHKSSDETTLVAEGKFNDVIVKFQGYVPPTCHIEETTVEVPATTKLIRKIICTNGLEDEVSELERLKREQKSPAPSPQ